MTERERLYLLAELTPTEILNAFRNRYYTDGNNTENGIVANAINEILPRMILPPCKVGQTVWVLNQSLGAIYENRVACIKVTGESRYKNTIKVEYHNKMGEASYRKFTWAQIGKQVFLAREDAEKALRGRGAE